METSRFGYWLQVGANLGILAGLILVWYEINQNSQLTSTALLDSRFQTSIELGQATFGEDLGTAIARSYSDPGSLSDAEIEVLERYYVAHLNTIGRAYRLGQTGIMEQDGWLDWFPDENGRIRSPRLRRVLDSPFARAWWPAFSKINPLGTGEIPKQMDRLMALPPLRPANYYDSLRQDAETMKQKMSR